MTRHITRLNIEAFRGIKYLELRDLGDFNVVVGANNCGKTSVLEAIMLLGGPSEFFNILKVGRMRAIAEHGSRESYFDSYIYLFNRRKNKLFLAVSGSIKDYNVSAKLEGRIEKILVDYEKNESQMERQENQTDNFIGELRFESGDRSNYSKKISIKYNKYSRVAPNELNPAVINMNFISAVDHIVKKDLAISDNKLKEQVVALLKKVDANISNLIIEENGINMYVVDDLSYCLPVAAYGDGIKKVIALANGIAAARDGVLLIDEIEASIHKVILPDVFAFLFRAAADNNVQIFITTDSLEAVDAILNIETELIHNQSKRIITLMKKEDKTVARILTSEKALQVREDYDMDLRI